MANLGHRVARTTIANVLKRHGIGPAPERIKQTTWKEFSKRHWDQIIATDFFSGGPDVFGFNAIPGALLCEAPLHQRHFIAEHTGFMCLRDYIPCRSVSRDRQGSLSRIFKSLRDEVFELLGLIVHFVPGVLKDRKK